MLVYRVQPQNADLHGIETIDSNEEFAGGVHVCESIQELRLLNEGPNERNVEIVTVECEKRDLKPNGDYQGVTLKAGRGRIVSRQAFDSINDVIEWIDETAGCRE